MYWQVTTDQTKNNNSNYFYSITKFVNPNKDFVIVQVPNKVKTKGLGAGGWTPKSSMRFKLSPEILLSKILKQRFCSKCHLPAHNIRNFPLLEWMCLIAYVLSNSFISLDFFIHILSDSGALFLWYLYWSILVQMYLLVHMFRYKHINVEVHVK